VKGDRKRDPSRRQGVRPDSVRQVCGPGGQAGWRGVPHHEQDEVLAVIEGDTKKKLADIKGKTKRKQK
jgi:hypothetical protein